MKGRFRPNYTSSIPKWKKHSHYGASFGIGEQPAYCLAPFAAHLLLVRILRKLMVGP